jgi:predicted type IV restriction endonuclease
MKDPTDKLMTALYSALNGNVSYGGSSIPVYTRVIDWSDRTCDQYIQIADVLLDEDGTKDAYISNGDVSIIVDTFFTGKKEGSWTPANSIASSITELIDDVILTLSGFTQILARISRIESPDYTLDDGGIVMQKLITYSFIIQEN